jgi:hypothetical protein
MQYYANADLSAAFKSRSSSFWEHLLPAATNNYYIRSLLGPRFFRYPVLPINETHIWDAKVQVSRGQLPE